jgi:hypothetical protein
MATEEEHTYILATDFNIESLKQEVEWKETQIQQAYLAGAPTIGKKPNDKYAFYYQHPRKNSIIELSIDQRDYNSLSVIEESGTSLDKGMRIRSESNHHEITYKKMVDGATRPLEIEDKIAPSIFQDLWKVSTRPIMKTRFKCHTKMDDGTPMEWVVDFLKDTNNPTDIYMVRAEVEVPEGHSRPDPKYIPQIISNDIVYEPAQNEDGWSNYACADRPHTEQMIAGVV